MLTAIVISFAMTAFVVALLATVAIVLGSLTSVSGAGGGLGAGAEEL